MAIAKVQPPPLSVPILQSIPKAASSNENGVNPLGNKQWLDWFLQNYGAINGTGVFSEGTHAQRLATVPSNFPEGSVFYESDRTVTYLLMNQLWIYAFGTLEAPQASLPGDLTTHDANFLASITDYGHELRWTGTAWTWGPGDDGSGRIAAFLSAPTTPGWALCNGATVNRLNPDGTITPVVLPDYTTAAYLKMGTSVLGVASAGGLTDLVGVGTPTGSISGNTGAPSATAVVQSGAGATPGTGTHTHDGSSLIFTGNDMGTHQHGPGTIDLRNQQLAAYYRQ